jgi:hypothetical protein
VPPNYRQQQGLPLASHERRAAVAIVAAVVAAGVGLGAYEVAGGGGAHQGRCVTVVLASSTGGGSSTRCAQAAVTFCRAEATADNAVAAQAQAACRRAGLLPRH